MNALIACLILLGVGLFVLWVIAFPLIPWLDSRELRALLKERHDARWKGRFCAARPNAPQPYPGFSNPYAETKSNNEN